MEKPFALFLTWTTYGTWLPGDPRGYVSNTLTEIGAYLPKQNTPGTDYTKDDPRTLDRARKLQKYETVWLSAMEAEWAAEAFVEIALEKGWRILRGAVMSNHVHLLVTDCPEDGPAVRRILKGSSQAKMSDRLGHSRHWWTQGGSDRYLHDIAAIEAVDHYVENQVGMLAQIIDTHVAHRRH